jgi:hypothetical protein
MFQKKFIGISQ